MVQPEQVTQAFVRIETGPDHLFPVRGQEYGGTVVCYQHAVASGIVLEEPVGARPGYSGSYWGADYELVDVITPDEDTYQDYWCAVCHGLATAEELRNALDSAMSKSPE